MGRNHRRECYTIMATKTISRKGPAIERKPAKRLRAVKARKEAAPSSVQELFESIAEMGRRMPPEIRAKIPTDLARNHEHYLYGHPKQD
jgi:hypothetical protein